MVFLRRETVVAPDGHHKLRAGVRTSCRPSRGRPMPRLCALRRWT